MTGAFCANQIILRSTAAPIFASSSSSWILAFGGYFDSVGHGTWQWFPRLEFASYILTTSLTQFAHNARILCRQLVFQFIESFDRRQYRYGNFNNVLRHAISVPI
jgi:hypothetical protein